MPYDLGLGDNRKRVLKWVPPAPTGHPAASIPCGLTPKGLPVGLQVVGPKYAERAILEACLAIETLLTFNPIRAARMAAF